MIHLRNWLRSFYTQLFITLFIIILPLQITQLAMYDWGNKAVKQELNSAAESNVIYLRDNFVTNVNAINSQLEYLLSNYTVTSFFTNLSYSTTWDYYTSIIQINNLLALLKNSNPYLQEIVLYLPTHHIMLSSRAMIEIIDPEEIYTTIDDFKTQQSLLMEKDKQIMVGHLSPPTAYFTKEVPQFFVQAVFSERAIKSHLSSFSQYSNKNALMLNHNTNSAFSSNDNIINDSAQLGALTTLITPRDNEDVYASYIILNKQTYVTVACYSRQINCSFVQLIPAETLRTIPNRFSNYIRLFTVLALIVIVAYSLIMYRLVKLPMNDMIRAYSIAGSGDFNHNLTVKYTSYEFNQLAIHFNEMTKRIKSLIQTNFEQTILLQRAELKQLQAQINPHFLYNSFFFLRHAIGQNDDQARIFASYLGKYFQYITKNDTDLVQLHLEYEHAINYLNIQLLRFKDRISSEVEALPEAYNNLIVPRLILQPIFENILEHGINNIKCDGLIRLHFVSEENKLMHIFVEDNGDRLTDKTLRKLQEMIRKDASIQETSGLTNIHKRLQLHFGEKCGLRISRSQLGGLCVDVIINIEGEMQP